MGGVSKLIKERKLHKLRKKANLIIADYQESLKSRGCVIRVSCVLNLYFDTPTTVFMDSSVPENGPCDCNLMVHMAAA